MICDDQSEASINVNIDQSEASIKSVLTNQRAVFKSRDHSPDCRHPGREHSGASLGEGQHLLQSLSRLKIEIIKGIGK